MQALVNRKLKLITVRSSLALYLLVQLVKFSARIASTVTGGLMILVR